MQTNKKSSNNIKRQLEIPQYYQDDQLKLDQFRLEILQLQQLFIQIDYPSLINNNNNNNNNNNIYFRDSSNSNNSNTNKLETAEYSSLSSLSIFTPNTSTTEFVNNIGSNFSSSTFSSNNSLINTPIPLLNEFVYTDPQLVFDNNNVQQRQQYQPINTSPIISNLIFLKNSETMGNNDFYNKINFYEPDQHEESHLSKRLRINYQSDYIINQFDNYENKFSDDPTGQLFQFQSNLVGEQGSYESIVMCNWDS